MEPDPHRRKIEETVVQILKTADLEKITLYHVRTKLSEQLNIDLSDLDRKRLVQQAVDSYLLSLPGEEIQKETENDAQEQLDPTPKSNFNPLLNRENSERIICKLSNKRSVSVQNSGEKALVSFRDCHKKDGKQYNSSRAICLTADQWSAFRNSVPAIEEAIVKMESRKRKSNDAGKPIEADKSTTVTAFAPRVECSIERQQTEAGVSNSTTAFAPGELIPIDRQQTQRNMPSSVPDVAPNSQVQHDSVTVFPPQGLIPIETSRLNGRNYNCWMREMYFFLNQLNIVYVLTEPCPSIPQHEEASSEKTVQAKAAARKWIDDDYLCHRNILNSLSDHLFDQYSKKMLNAKELWEDLKISFNEDFGTKRSQVNKYIQFQMVDGVSVLEQVQELHNIADSIIASGMWVDENFHVSAIVSKLPPSWKECRLKLMQEEFLPLNKLMYTLRVEEESRRNSESSKNAHMVASKLENDVGSKKKEIKRLCYTCGNEGHIAKNCPLRKFMGPSNGNDNNVAPPVSTEVNMVERNVE